MSYSPYRPLRVYSYSILTKFSDTNKTPSSLEKGELAYSFVTGDSEGGERLMIGTGLASPNHYQVIGGSYYSNMMDHPKGQVVPGSAIITDGDNKINQINIDNITIDGDEISNTSGAITLNPNTFIDASSSPIRNLSDPSNPQDAATKNYIDTSVSFIANADTNVSGTGNIVQGEQLLLNGGDNISTTRANIAGGVRVIHNLNDVITNLTSVEIGNVKIEGSTISTTSGGDLIIDPHPDGNDGKVIIKGDFQVDGTTTTINSTTLEVDDKNITLAAGVTTRLSADSAGIHVDGANADIYYQASTNTWNFNKNVVAPNMDVDGQISGTSFSGVYLGFDSDLNNTNTSRLPEGDNLYYTTARADSAAKNAISVNDIGGDGALSYNNVNGVITYRGPSAAEVRSHFSASGDLSYDSSRGVFSIDVETVYTKVDFDSDLGDASTDDLPEGANLYYTNERVDDRVAALLSMAEGMDASYNDATGVLTLSTELATDTNIGAAKFDSVDFLVTAGMVEIQTIDCGLF